MKAWAEQLGKKEAVDLLDHTLAEEKKADETLTQIAEDIANPRAKKRAA
jgi:ferritin-like metal-binding protein YciE